MSASLRKPATTESAWIPVNLKIVGSTQSVASEITKPAVNVDQVTRAILMKGADSMSACQTLNVLTHLPVAMRSVLTRAKIVPLMQIVLLEITEQTVNAKLATKAIHMVLSVPKVRIKNLYTFLRKSQVFTCVLILTFNYFSTSPCKSGGMHNR